MISPALPSNPFPLRAFMDYFPVRRHPSKIGKGKSIF